MKRFTAASVAAATALTLLGAPAQAETKASSEVTDAEAIGYALGKQAAERVKPGSGVSGPYKSSSEKGLVPNSATSSLRNDAARGYRLGTTWDILVGTGIAAAVLAVLGGGAWAAQQGLIPGVQLP